MAFYVGDVVTQGFYTGAAGESFTYVSRNPSAATFLSVANVTDLGGGDYLLSFTASVAGNYYGRLTGATSGEIIKGNWTVNIADGMTQARAAKLDSLGAAGVSFLPGPVEVNGVRTIYKRTDYKNADARSLDWTTADDATWPDLTGATIAFASRAANGDATAGITATGTVIAATGAKQVRVELTRTATVNAKPGLQTYQVRATLTNGDVIPLATGQVMVIDYLG